MSVYSNALTVKKSVLEQKFMYRGIKRGDQLRIPHGYCL